MSENRSFLDTTAASGLTGIAEAVGAARVPAFPFTHAQSTRPDRGAGNNRAVSPATASSFRTRLARWASDDQRADRGRSAGRRVLTQVSRAAWRLEQAERERAWALASARAEGISIHTLATAIGLSRSRVRQLVAGVGLDALAATPGELRAAGWPTLTGPVPGGPER